jgi:hypothetical protein
MTTLLLAYGIDFDDEVLARAIGSGADMDMAGMTSAEHGQRTFITFGNEHVCCAVREGLFETSSAHPLCAAPTLALRRRIEKLRRIVADACGSERGMRVGWHALLLATDGALRQAPAAARREFYMRFADDGTT